jgi:hypothetical protein
MFYNKNKKRAHAPSGTAQETARWCRSALRVERTFGTRTCNSGWRYARSRGRARTGAHQGLPRAAKTLRRAASFAASANSFRPVLGAGRGGG